eukprot:GHVQ01015051.1.p1 GENE.GHVQ01015051.1~~GHVQ01015051.1.p1  ORF type:complete len:150 (-),score=11.11 GHVQ01015051.1:111-560(-)
MPLTNCLAKMIRNVLVTAESVSISSGRCLLNRSSVSSSVCSSLSTLGLCHRSFTIFSEFMQKRAEKISRIPFGVRRTASDNFPVYLKWRKNKTEVFTVLKKIHGNKQVLSLSDCLFWIAIISAYTTVLTLLFLSNNTCVDFEKRVTNYM